MDEFLTLVQMTWTRGGKKEILPDALRLYYLIIKSLHFKIPGLRFYAASSVLLPQRARFIHVAVVCLVTGEFDVQSTALNMYLRQI